MIYELYHYAVQYNQVTMVSPTVFVNYILYRGVRGRKTKVGRKLLRFPPTRFTVFIQYSMFE